MIKILGVSGSQVKEGNVSALLEDALSQSKKFKDVSSEVIHLAGKKIGPGLHCNWCINKQTAERPCFQEAAIVPFKYLCLKSSGNFSMA